MAMLAEPRRRQRIGPNPRGKFFSEDETNRGRALLQKLGWKNGDGLGIQKQGMSEPIRPKIQMDSKGLGFDIKSDPWMSHSKEFAEVLENLQTVHGVKKEIEDERAKLESKSKGSRSRIHYHKFTRGKDLSRITGEDWTCLFGKVVDLNNSTEIQPTEDDMRHAEPAVVKIKVEAELEQQPDALNTINMGSMYDYFNKKKVEKTKRESLPSCEFNLEYQQEDGKKKKKRKSVKDYTEPNSVDETPRADEVLLNKINDAEVEKIKKKKKRKIIPLGDEDSSPQLSDIKEPLANPDPSSEAVTEDHMSEAWQKNKKLFLLPKHIHLIYDEFGGANLKNVDGYGMR